MAIPIVYSFLKRSSACDPLQGASSDAGPMLGALLILAGVTSPAASSSRPDRGENGRAVELVRGFICSAHPKGTFERATFDRAYSGRRKAGGHGHG